MRNVGLLRTALNGYHGQHFSGLVGRVALPKIAHTGPIHGLSGARSLKTHSQVARNGITEESEISTKLQDEEPVYSTVIAQARRNMQQFDHCVLLTRVGSFYELYFEQAKKYGPLLNLKVADKGRKDRPVAMAGFPFYQLDRYLKMLVQDFSQHVAISEEFPKSAIDVVKTGMKSDRRVTRTITPGTLIDEKFMDPYENNFLLAVHTGSDVVVHGDSTAASIPDELKEASAVSNTAAAPVGLAWLDLSTGDFLTQKSTRGLLPSLISRINAREIVVIESADESLLTLLDHQKQLLTFHTRAPAFNSTESWSPMLESEMSEKLHLDMTPEEREAGSLLLSYVSDQMHGSSLKLQIPTRKQEREFMSIDRNTMKALEILSTSKDGLTGGKGSLLHTIRRTVTKSGARLLRDWISSPSMSLETINQRLDSVTSFLEDQSFKQDIILQLKGSFDSQRLAQKFSMGRGDADDLISLLKTIEATCEIARRIQVQIDEKQLDAGRPGENSLAHLNGRFILEGPIALAESIRQAIDEAGLMEHHRQEEEDAAATIPLAREVLESEGTLEDKLALSKISKAKMKIKDVREPLEMGTDEVDTWILRRTACEALDEYHGKLDELYHAKQVLAQDLRHSLQAQSLTLRWTPGLRWFCHVRGSRDVAASLKGSRATATSDVKTTKSTRSFHHADWTRLGQSIDQAKDRIRAAEQGILRELREQVVMNLIKLRRNAAVLDELDVAASFATLAQEQNLTRPKLTNEMSHDIVAGRHLTVEQGLAEQGRAFVSNDCHIGGQERTWLITGPNMAGKSTFLRQNALISILAQVGSYVPAEHAEIGLVDQVFTRVGSADNLFRDQSTFMVEMIETANILNQATSQSFVIMDEIGRGTTPEDGIAISFACLHHLYYKNRCRTLFATHFHALADMTESFDKLGCYCTDVAEGPSGTFSFVHRLKPGINRSSHALKVAQLAGVPNAAIETARIVLEGFDRTIAAPPVGTASMRAAVY